jgi:hypothetical protein
MDDKCISQSEREKKKDAQLFVYRNLRATTDLASQSRPHANEERAEEEAIEAVAALNVLGQLAGN